NSGAADSARRSVAERAQLLSARIWWRQGADVELEACSVQRDFLERALGRAAEASVVVQGSEHLIDFADMKLGFSSRRSGRLPVEHVVAVCSVDKAGEECQGEDRRREAEHDEKEVSLRHCSQAPAVA